MEFEKNIWKLPSALRNIWTAIIVSRANFTRWTYRQQHKFHFANGPEATEEGQETDECWGYYENVHGTREKVGAQQFAEKITIYERDQANNKYGQAADLQAKEKQS